MRGFTLLEMLIATAVFVITVSGVLALFMGCLDLDETNRNLMVAFTSAQSRMERLKSQAFDTLSAANGQVFDLDGFASGTGKGRINVTAVNVNLATVEITACFISHGRTIGNNIDNCTLSPVKIVTQIAR